MFEKDKYCKDGKPNREVPKADFEKDTEPYKDYTWWSLGLLGLAILATLACAAFTWPLTVPIIAIVVFAITSVVLHSKGKSHTEDVEKANKDRTAFNEAGMLALQETIKLQRLILTAQEFTIKDYDKQQPRTARRS